MRTDKENETLSFSEAISESLNRIKKQKTRIRLIEVSGVVTAVVSAAVAVVIGSILLS